MRAFQISLGEQGDAGTDYGTYEGTTPEAALAACQRDADHTREYATPELLSTSSGFGRGDRRINGNGAADRSGWWYVTDATTGVLAGIYTVAEARRDA